MQVVILTTNTDAQRQVRYLGPYQIAWWLRENGYETQVLDYLYFMTSDDRIALFKKFITNETKIVGFAPFVTPRAQKMEIGENIIYEILEEIKENFPWVKIIIGGPLVVDFLVDRYQRISFKVDAVFKGESEHSFLSYCNYIFKNEGHPPFLIENNMKIINPTKDFNIQNCRMRYSKNDFILPDEFVPFELARGCIFKCKFCQYPNIGKTTDDFIKSMDLIRESFIHNYRMFGTTKYHFTDDTFNSHRENTKAFYEMAKTLPFKLEYIGYVRMDLLDIWPEQIDILPESGLASCHFGIESFDPYSCKQIGKGWGAKNHRKWINYLRNDAWKNNVIMRCSFIAGLGKETEKDWEETTKWILEHKVHDFVWQPLYISTVNKLSIFDKNPEEYGYTITGQSSWVSESTSYEEAWNWCSRNNQTTNKVRIPAAWDYAAIRSLGYSKEEIINSNHYDIYHDRIKKKKSERLVRNYLKLAMAY
jgi:radical SAM superfamily enzyme YgiQ (UPF0313 family)